MSQEKEIERLVIRLIGDGTKYQKMLQEAEMATKKTEQTVTRSITKLERVQQKLNAIGAGFINVGRRMSSMGRSMALRVTAPLTLIGGLAAREFGKFDKAMVESTSIMRGATDEQKKSMRSVALEMVKSGNYLQGPDELAKSYFYLASAGKDAAQSMALLPTVSKFATAGAFDMALATDLLTDAQSALGMTSKDTVKDMEKMTRLGDVLVKANTLANASVEQFSIALTTKAGAALKVYNKDVEEGVAVLLAMADQGMKAELAGNALDRITRLLSKSALDNAKAHEKYGFTVFDNTGKMRNFADIVGNLETSLAGMSDETRAAALDAMGFDARVQGVILPLLGSSEAIRRYEKELRSASGITKEVADDQMTAFSNQMKVMWNQIKVVAISIGETLAPMLLKLNEVIRGGIDWWNNLSESTKRFIIKSAIVVAVLGPIIALIGTATIFVGAFIASLGAILPALAAIGAAVASPLSLVLALVAAVTWLGAALAALIKTGEKAKDKAATQAKDKAATQAKEAATQAQKVAPTKPILSYYSVAAGRQVSLIDPSRPAAPGISPDFNDRLRSNSKDRPSKETEDRSSKEMVKLLGELVALQKEEADKPGIHEMIENAGLN